MYCHCSEHLQVSENTKTESSFVKLTEIKKKKSELLGASRRRTSAGCQSSPALIWPPPRLRAQRVIPALPQKWLAPSFMAQKQTMREEKPEKRVSRFTWLTNRAGPSTRGRLLGERSPIKLDWWAWKPFRQNICSLPFHTALCVIFTDISY